MIWWHDDLDSLIWWCVDKVWSAIVCVDMPFQVVLPGEHALADLTRKSSQRVESHMTVEVAPVIEAFGTAWMLTAVFWSLLLFLRCHCNSTINFFVKAKYAHCLLINEIREMFANWKQTSK